MPLSSDFKTLTVRLPPGVYQAAQQVARQRHLSLNALLQESLTATLRAAEEQERYDDYSLLGADVEMCSVDYALAAQAEVMLSDDPA